MVRAIQPLERGAITLTDLREKVQVAFGFGISVLLEDRLRSKFPLPLSGALLSRHGDKCWLCGTRFN